MAQMAHDMNKDYFDPSKPLKPFNSFNQLSAQEWDLLIHAVVPFRELHQKLILTRCSILEKQRTNGKIARLDSLD